MLLLLMACTDRIEPNLGTGTVEPIEFERPSFPTPTPPLDRELVFASAYGPRESDGADEFHLGLDMPGERGEAVLSMLPGIVKTVRIPENDADSLFVIVEHEVETFAWQGLDHNRIYTSYHHLDSVLVSEEQALAEGEQLGTMGDSGNAEAVHLHLELRLGTHCSLEYQRENPESSCNLGFSPHVDPLLLLPSADLGGPSLQLDGTTLTVTAPTQDPGIGRIETDRGTLDFSEWIGVSNESDEDRDDLDLRWVLIDPMSSEEERVMWLEFEEAPSRATVWDARGERPRSRQGGTSL